MSAGRVAGAVAVKADAQSPDRAPGRQVFGAQRQLPDIARQGKGQPAHRRTLAVLRQHAIPYDGRSRPVQPADLRRFDYLLAMDSQNAADLKRLDHSGALDGKLHRLLDFAPAGYPQDVPDPYYDGRFEYVYELVDAASRGLLAHIRQEHRL